MDPTTQRLMMGSNFNQPFLGSLFYFGEVGEILSIGGFDLDSNGNAYVCATTVNTIGGSSNNKAILFKLKYGNLGAIVEWAKSITTSGQESYSDVAVSNDGSSIYVVGAISNSGLLVKYNSSGTIQWSRYLQGNFFSGLANPQNAYQSVTVDSAGDVYITGYVIKSGDTENNVFIAKYNSSGTIQWQKYEQYYDASFDSYGTSIASVPSSGGFVITGYVQQSGGVSDILVTKFTTAGNVAWKKIISSAGDEYGESIGTDSAGDVYVSGSINNTNIYLTKLNGATGNTFWQRSLGSAFSERETKIYVDPSTGDCYISGQQNSSIIIAKYNTSGILQWQRTTSLPITPEFSLGISLGSDKMLYLLVGDSYFGGITYDILRVDPNGNGTFLTSTNYTNSVATLVNSPDASVGGDTSFTEASASGLITEADANVSVSST